MRQVPQSYAIHNVEKHDPQLSSQKRKPLSFEEAMKHTREKHAEVIKRLGNN